MLPSAGMPSAIAADLASQARLAAEDGAYAWADFREEVVVSHKFRAMVYLPVAGGFLQLLHTIEKFSDETAPKHMEMKVFGFVGDRGEDCEPLVVLLPENKTWQTVKVKVATDEIAFAAWLGNEADEGTIWDPGDDVPTTEENLPRALLIPGGHLWWFAQQPRRAADYYAFLASEISKANNPVPKKVLEVPIKWTMAVCQAEAGHPERSCLALDMEGVSYFLPAFESWRKRALDMSLGAKQNVHQTPPTARLIPDMDFYVEIAANAAVAAVTAVGCSSQTGEAPQRQLSAAVPQAKADVTGWACTEQSEAWIRRPPGKDRGTYQNGVMGGLQHPQMARGPQKQQGIGRRVLLLWLRPKILTWFVMFAVGFVCFEACFFYNFADRWDEHDGDDGHPILTKQAKDWATDTEEQQRAAAMTDVGIPANSYRYGRVTPAEPCTLTIVVTDPNLSADTKHRARALWGALESVILHRPEDACVLLQTSACGTAGADDARAAGRKIANRVPAAMPLVKEFFQTSGRFRVALLEHKKYSLGPCENYNFGRQGGAWMDMRMNVNYWRDEFIESMDSDMVLMHNDPRAVLRGGAVLCNHLDIEPWQEFAYVGAPLADDQGDICRDMEGRWQSWTNQPMEMCTKGYGPQGSGLSLRSRKWMTKAIEACPTRYSGIPNDIARLSPCNPKKSGRRVMENRYFRTVLSGIRAPLPLAYEAALFSSGRALPEMVLRWSVEQQMQAAKKRLDATGAKRYKAFLKDRAADYFVPIGFQKFDGNHSQSFFMDPGLQEKCPYLKYIAPLN